jgi:hypothetical protein
VAGEEMYSSVSATIDRLEPLQHPVATTDGGTARCSALRVPAHQSGSLIRTERCLRWPASLWPGRTRAPRRSRTYNPLAGSRVISSASGFASALVSDGAQVY